MPRENLALESLEKLGMRRSTGDKGQLGTQHKPGEPLKLAYTSKGGADG